MEFVLVHTNALRSHWPRIRASLEAVQAKSPEDWIPEDVYHALKSGDAACHIACNDGGFAGVLITTLTTTEFSGERALHVWIAHNTGPADVFDAGMQLLRHMAAQAGITRITCGSSRKGWGKRFRLLSATYEIT